MNPIYFDLDGTLTNPKPGITRSIQYALRKLDHEAPSEDELTWCIRPPLHASFKKLLGTEALADAAILLYRERFADVGLFENEVYPGIEATLSALAGQGRHLFGQDRAVGLRAEGGAGRSGHSDHDRRSKPRHDRRERQRHDRGRRALWLRQQRRIACRRSPSPLGHAGRIA